MKVRGSEEAFMPDADLVPIPAESEVPPIGVLGIRVPPMLLSPRRRDTGAGLEVRPIPGREVTKPLPFPL